LFPHWTEGVVILRSLGSQLPRMPFTCVLIVVKKASRACMRKVFQGFQNKLCLHLEMRIPTWMHFQFLFLANTTARQASGNACKPSSSPSQPTTPHRDPPTSHPGRLELPALGLRQPASLPEGRALQPDTGHPHRQVSLLDALEYY